MNSSNFTNLLNNTIDSLMGETPQTINNGLCDYFASIVNEDSNYEAKVVGIEDFDATKNPLDYPHIWLYFNDKHYDAECVEGVDSWDQLPFFIRMNQTNH